MSSGSTTGSSEKETPESGLWLEIYKTSYGTGLEEGIEYPSRRTHVSFYHQGYKSRFTKILEVLDLRSNYYGLSLIVTIPHTHHPYLVEHHELWLFTHGPEAFAKFYKRKRPSLQNNARCDLFLTAILSYCKGSESGLQKIIDARRRTKIEAARQALQARQDALDRLGYCLRKRYQPVPSEDEFTNESTDLESGESSDSTITPNIRTPPARSMNFKRERY